MTTSNTPPDVQRILSQHARRLDILERRLRALEVAYEPELPFVQSGAVTAGESPPWVRRKGGKLVEVVALLGTAGTSATVIEVRKNGAAIGTITMPAGEIQRHLTLAERAAPDADRFTAAVTTAGSSAMDLTVATRWDQ